MFDKPLKTFPIYPFKPWIYWVCVSPLCLLWLVALIIEGFDATFTLLVLLIIAVFVLFLFIFSHVSGQRIHADYLRTTDHESISYQDIVAIHLVTVPRKIVRPGPWVCVERATPLFRYTPLPAKDAESFARCLIDHCPHASYYPQIRPMRFMNTGWQFSDTE